MQNAVLVLPDRPDGIQDLELEDGVNHAVSQLKSRGLLVIVVTNQPDVARGKTSRDAVDAIHSVLRRQLEIDDIFVCFHDDNDDIDNDDNDDDDDYDDDDSD